MPTALVTGSNRGIGLEFCRQLQAKGYDVIAVCRRPSEELQALGVRIEEGVDVTSDESIAALAKRLEGVSLDILINNAGILQQETLQNMDFEYAATI